MPAGQFHVGLKGLRRTQGAMKEFCLDAAFDEQIQTGLVCLPQGSPVRVEGSLESVGDGVLANATVSAVLDAQCSRCLADFSLPVEVGIQELFVYPEHCQEYEEEDATPIHDEEIDLADAVRDAIILDQPLIPLCSPDCRGLCPTCGADLNADPDHSHDDAVDSRWLALTEWGKMS